MDHGQANSQHGSRAASVLAWSLLIALAFASGRAGANPPAALAQGGAGELAPTDRTAAWPWQRGFGQATSSAPVTPHPAVVRIVVPEHGATAYGSGTLVDVRDQYGLVITNWHVVRDSSGTVEVVFPNGFRSHARPLKVDADWDLAALVVWRPPVEPVRVTQTPPRPGDRLSIHGYGQGRYRIASGHCTAFYAPKMGLPQEMVELDVEARQGDSGGPIFNDRGELAGVLFGAGEGTTIGSFAPRVDSFLATLAPDIGSGSDQTQLAAADRPAPIVHPIDRDSASNAPQKVAATSPSPPLTATVALSAPSSRQQPRPPATTALAPPKVASGSWYDRLKSALAIVGLVTIALQMIRVVK